MAFNEQFEDLFRSFQAKYDLRPGFQGDYDLRELFGDLVDDPSFVRDRVSILRPYTSIISTILHKHLFSYVR